MNRWTILGALLSALLMPASSSLAAARAVGSPSDVDRQQIIAVLERVQHAEEEKDLGSYLVEGWPEAQFTIRAGGELLSRASRRPWKDQIFSVGAVRQRVRLQPPRMLIAGNRARVHLEGNGVDLYSRESGNYTPAGTKFSETNDVVLEKRGSVWRVLNWDRVVNRVRSPKKSH